MLPVAGLHVVAGAGLHVVAGAGLRVSAGADFAVARADQLVHQRAQLHAARPACLVGSGRTRPRAAGLSSARRFASAGADLNLRDVVRALAGQQADQQTSRAIARARGQARPRPGLSEEIIHVMPKGSPGPSSTCQPSTLAHLGRPALASVISAYRASFLRGGPRHRRHGAGRGPYQRSRARLDRARRLKRAGHGQASAPMTVPSSPSARSMSSKSPTALRSALVERRAPVISHSMEYDQAPPRTTSGCQAPILASLRRLEAFGLGQPLSLSQATVNNSESSRLPAGSERLPARSERRCIIRSAERPNS